MIDAILVLLVASGWLITVLIALLILAVRRWFK